MLSVVLPVVFFGACELAAIPMKTAPGPPAVEVAAPMRIPVNKASLDELQRLPGIGPSKAGGIIRARQRRPFRKVSDLLRVKGIGRKTLKRLAPRVEVP